MGTAAGKGWSDRHAFRVPARPEVITGTAPSSARSLLAQQFNRTHAKALMSSRVLIAEDDYLQAKWLKLVVECEGCLVCGIVASGAEAVAMAINLRPDVVLMDFRLGDRIDGARAAELIQGHRFCRVVFVTGYADPVTTARINKVRHDGIIYKPARAQDLAAVIGRTGP
jgi:CheY-like chemotaxis protein